MRPLAYLDPATVLSLGYALHAAQDEALHNMASQELAQQAIRDFIATPWPADQTDRRYLTGVRLTVLAHGNAITRRKRHYTSSMADAETIYRDAQHKLRGNATTSVVATLVWKGAGAALLGGIGYLVPIVFPFLPHVTVGTGEKSAWSFLFALVFIVAGKWLMALVAQAKQSRITAAYTWRRQAAVLEYEEGKLHDGQIFHEQMITLWEDYTGVTHLEMPSYLLIMRGDIRTRRLMDRRLAAYSSSPFEQVKIFVRTKLKNRTQQCSTPSNTSASAPTFGSSESSAGSLS